MSGSRTSLMRSVREIARAKTNSLDVDLCGEMIEASNAMLIRSRARSFSICERSSPVVANVLVRRPSVPQNAI
jgi:hypothetical protein